MKKIFVLLCGLLLMAGAAQAQLSTVACVGTESGGAGGTLECAVPHAYTYVVTPGVTPITNVIIPTDDPMMPRYTNICAPTGWNMTIVGASFSHADKTAHGTISGPSTGNCPFAMNWTGPATAVPFELGFDHPWTSHNVSWFDDDTGTNWAAPVGLGAGPIHAPQQQIPTLSQYGMIAVVVLLLAAGTVFIVRRRRAEA
jgi:hypothetical protein